MQVGGEDKAGVLDPLHHSLRLCLDPRRVVVEKVWEVPVEVEVVGIVPGREKMRRKKKKRKKKKKKKKRKEKKKR